MNTELDSGKATAKAAAFLAAADLPLLVLPVAPDDPLARMRAEVSAGLDAPGQKSVPPTYFYDEEGSELYEAITSLPEYYPTRTEARLIAQHAPALAERLGPVTLVELGSGSSTKTRLLFDAFGARRQGLTYVSIDASAAMQELGARYLIEDYPRLRVLALVGQYEEALTALPPGDRRLFLFLGGTIGNFPPAFQAHFCKHLASRMRPGNHLLLGFDRRAHAGKPAAVIQAAYDDQLGITARFNVNLLAHLNRALGADFVPARWAHEAVYNATAHQIEMYLCSRQDQVVTIPSLERVYPFAAGERILTEISRKFDPTELAAWFAGVGLDCVQQWTDERGYFGLMLLRK